MMAESTPSELPASFVAVGVPFWAGLIVVGGLLALSHSSSL